MKIEIDLNDILGDPDYGVETLQDSVKRQIVSALTQKVQVGIEKQINTEISKVIDDTIKKNIEGITPTIFEDIMNAEYIKVDRWGDRSKGTTTFRKQLIEKITEEMVYVKKNYDSEKNVFTKAVDQTIEANLNIFKKEFDTKVNELFVKECFEYAQKKMQEKLGIK